MDRLVLVLIVEIGTEFHFESGAVVISVSEVTERVLVFTK